MFVDSPRQLLPIVLNYRCESNARSPPTERMALKCLNEETHRRTNEHNSTKKGFGDLRPEGNTAFSCPVKNRLQCFWVSPEGTDPACAVLRDMARIELRD